MNKYLKTYIRNRDIAIINKKNPKEYELGYIDTGNLTNNGIIDLLYNSNKPQKVIDILLNNKILVSNLTDKGIRYLLVKSTEPQNIIYKVGNKANEYISNLTDDGIYSLLYHSTEPDKIKEIIKKYRPDINLDLYT